MQTNKLQLYWHTLKWLKPVQISNRIRRKLIRPTVELGPAPKPAVSKFGWTPCARRPSMLGHSRLDFLSVTRELKKASDWNNPAWPKLWLYNAHYFDDLAADNWTERAAWQKGLINRWIIENPPAVGNGWEPYPISLRIVNWMKWSLLGNDLGEQVIQSLAVQCRYLTRSLEYHLLGNHLWANAKALCFAGMFFEGPEADAWLRKGVNLLREQLAEQIMPDGGHFERSPMYHSILLEDVLDLIQINRLMQSRSLGAELHNSLLRAATAMSHWLSAMSHPDGDIALFNDATFGIAPTPASLQAYRQILGLAESRSPVDQLLHLKHTGYAVCRNGPWHLIADVGDIGPDYLPGHAHADTLSFELSYLGSRVFVDSGLSTYEANALRAYQRSTRAHNTVCVGQASSSEVWGGFRVARRARVWDINVSQSESGATIEAAHDGYMRLGGKNMHRRRWTVSANQVQIDDEIEGKPTPAEANWYLSPHYSVEPSASGYLLLNKQSDKRLHMSFDSGKSYMFDSKYYDGFGRETPNKCIRVMIQDNKLRTTVIRA